MACTVFRINQLPHRRRKWIKPILFRRGALRRLNLTLHCDIAVVTEFSRLVFVFGVSLHPLVSRSLACGRWGGSERFCAGHFVHLKRQKNCKFITFFTTWNIRCFKIRGCSLVDLFSGQQKSNLRSRSVGAIFFRHDSKPLAKRRWAERDGQSGKYVRDSGACLAVSLFKVLFVSFVRLTTLSSRIPLTQSCWRCRLKGRYYRDLYVLLRVSWCGRIATVDFGGPGDFVTPFELLEASASVDTCSFLCTQISHLHSETHYDFLSPLTTHNQS